MRPGKRSRRRSGDEATVAYVSCSGHYYPLQHPAGLSVLLLPGTVTYCIQSWSASRWTVCSSAEGTSFSYPQLKLGVQGKASHPHESRKNL